MTTNTEPVLVYGTLRIGDSAYRIEEHEPKRERGRPVTDTWYEVSAWCDGRLIARAGCLDGDTGDDWAVGAVVRRCFADSRTRGN
jgi:hypothetical protein